MGSIGKLKIEVINWLLEAEDYILLVVNPEVEGVDLPPELLEGGQPVGINIGLRMAIPIPDLVVDPAGISGTLSFNHTPHHCVFPWASIMQVSEGLEHLIWVEPPPTEQVEEPEIQPSRPRLKLV